MNQVQCLPCHWQMPHTATVHRHFYSRVFPPFDITFPSLGLVLQRNPPVFVTTISPSLSPANSSLPGLIFYQFVSDWEAPSKSKWSILMEDIFGKETSSGVTVVRSPWGNPRSPMLRGDRGSLRKAAQEPSAWPSLRGSCFTP